jgi:hypothetical protein
MAGPGGDRKKSRGSLCTVELAEVTVSGTDSEMGLRPPGSDNPTRKKGKEFYFRPKVQLSPELVPKSLLFSPGGGWLSQLA